VQVWAIALTDLAGDAGAGLALVAAALKDDNRQSR